MFLLKKHDIMNLKGDDDMDFTIVNKIEREMFCYKLLRANFYRDHYVIIAQSKSDFACGSFCATRESALFFFRELAESDTEPHTLNDILCDYQKQRM